MGTISRVETLVMSALDAQGLTSYVDLEQTQFLELDHVSVDLVLTDGAKVEEARTVLEALQDEAGRAGDQDFIVSVRAKWRLEEVGESEELRTADGRLTAASVVPVVVVSGTQNVRAYVIVTYEAAQTLKHLVRRDFRLREVAEVICDDRLGRTGQSAWDPVREPTIQINSSAAIYVSKLLRQAA